MKKLCIVFVMVIVVVVILVMDRDDKPELCVDDVRSGKVNLEQEQLGQYWDEFLKVNRGWLDPKVSSLHYKVTTYEGGIEYVEDPDGYEVKELDLVVDGSIYSFYWDKKSEEDIFCRSDNSFAKKKMRFLGNGKLMYREDYSLNGHSHSTSPNMQHAIDTVGLNDWYMSRVGTGFFSVLVSLSYDKLPEGALIREQTSELVEVEVPVVIEPFKKVGNVQIEKSSAYYPEPMGFGMLRLYPDSIKVVIDKQTMKLLSIEEVSGERTAHITFDKWAMLGGMPVPESVTCSLPDDQGVIAYDFSVENGVWLAKGSVLRNPDSYSLCVKSEVIYCDKDEIADSVFDYTIPAKSETTLAGNQSIIEFETADGLVLEGKLSMPEGAEKPVAAVLFLHGSCVSTFDVKFVAPDFKDPKNLIEKTHCLCDFYAEEFTKRGIAFFSINKRGCVPLNDYPYVRVSRQVFSKATPSVLISDYCKAVDALVEQRGIDPARVILFGQSEGARLAGRVAKQSGGKVAAAVMTGYPEESLKEIIRWQIEVGAWNNLLMLFDEDHDGEITAEECDQSYARIKEYDKFRQYDPAGFDRNKDGHLSREDLSGNSASRVFRAVEEKDRDFIWSKYNGLSLDYMLEDWEGAKSSEYLLDIDIPLAIFHGGLDASCSVEGVYETQRKIESAGKGNLYVKIFPNLDHELGVAKIIKEEGVPAAYVEIFDYIVDMSERLAVSD